MPERLGGHVVSVQVQDVEQVQVDPHADAKGLLRVSHLHPPLEPGEAGAIALEGHDLAIDDEPVGFLRGKRLGELRVVVIQL